MKLHIQQTMFTSIQDIATVLAKKGGLYLSDSLWYIESWGEINIYNIYVHRPEKLLLLETRTAMNIERNRYLGLRGTGTYICCI